MKTTPENRQEARHPSSLRRWARSAVLLAALAGGIGAAHGQAFYFDFDTPGQLTNNFGMRNKAGNQGMVWTESLTNGVYKNLLPSGSLDNARAATSDESTITYLGTPLPFPNTDGASLNLSIMFKIRPTVASSTQPLMQLGVLGWTNSVPPTNSFMEGNGLANWLNLRVAINNLNTNMTLEYGTYITTNSGSTFGYSNVVTAAFPTEDLPNLTNKWYKLNATFARTADPTKISFSGSLQSMGANGLTPGATYTTLAPTLITHVNMGAFGTNAWPAFRAVEGVGVDSIDNFAAWMTNGQPVVLTVADQTVSTYRRATITAVMDGTPPYTFTWFTNYVEVVGETGPTYTTPVLKDADVMLITCGVSSDNGSAVFDYATLTVVPDSVQPDVVSVGSVDGKRIGVVYSEEVETTAAGNKNNYTVAGGTVSSVIVRPDGRSVELVLAAPLTGAFTVTVDNVSDLAGNNLGIKTQSGAVEGLTLADLSLPMTPSAVFSPAAASFDLFAGGSDIWGTYDQGGFLYSKRDGDFDVIVRVQGMTRKYFWNTNAGRDDFAKASLMVREALEGPARMIQVNSVTPDYGMPSGANGVNRFQTAYRTSYYGSAATLTDVNIIPNGGYYPNEWMRLRRINNTFTIYWSTNGTTWNQLAQTTQVYPLSTFVGLAATAHYEYADYGITTQFRNFGNYAAPGATLDFFTNLPATVTVPYTTVPTTLSVAAANTASNTFSFANNEIQFIWQRADGKGGFTNLPTAGAAPTGTLNVNAAYANYIPALTPADNGAQFRVVAKGPDSLAVTSAVTTVVIPAIATQPAVVSAMLPVVGGNMIALTFNNPLDATTVTNVANFRVVNAFGETITLSSAALETSTVDGANVTRVVLYASTVLPAGPLSVTVLGGLRGTNGMSAVVSTTTAGYGAVKVELWSNLGTGSLITDLTGNAKYTANMPDVQFFTNSFAYGASSSGFNDNMNAYGGRISAYFMPPSNGTYRFYIRQDDSARLYINTNGADPAGKTLLTTQDVSSATYGSVISNSMTVGIKMTNGGLYYIEALWKEGSGNDGVALTFREAADASTPPASEIAGNKYFSPVVPDFYPVRVDVYTGLSGNTGQDLTNFLNSVACANGLASTTFMTNIFGFYPTLPSPGYTDNYAAKITAYFVAPSNGFYRFYTRGDDATQIYMNTNAANSTDPAGKKLIARCDKSGQGFNAAAGANGNNLPGQSYPSESVAITMTAGQRYYTEAILKEGTGGDGINIAFRAYGNITDANNSSRPIPATSEFTVGNFFQPIQPVTKVPDTANPVRIEIFTAIGSSLTAVADLTNSAKFINNAVDYTLVSNVFGFNTSLGNSFVDNYGARLTAYFIPTNTGWYRFFIKSDDASQLFLNTNAVDSINPAGKTAVATLITWRNSYTNNDAAMSTNIYLLQGQKYYMEALYKEGTGGDGFAVTMRYYADEASALAPVAPTDANEVLGSTLFQPAPAPGQIPRLTPTYLAQSTIQAEVYKNTGAGSTVADLLNAPRYLGGTPDDIWYMPYFGFNRDLVDSPALIAGNAYGVHVAGYFQAPYSGVYRFYIRSDDAAQLYMNTNTTDARSAQRVLIAQNTAYSGSYAINVAGESMPITLTNGQRYFMEAFLKEGGGGDGFSVAFRYFYNTTLATGTRTAPANTEFIPATYFAPLTGIPVIGVAGGTTVTNGQTVTASISSLTGAYPVSYQWRVNGKPIAGSNDVTFTYTVNQADGLAGLITLSAVAYNPYGVSVEKGANLVLNNDPLMLFSVVGNGFCNEVNVNFNKGVLAATATNLANYSIPGLTITGAFIKNYSTVVLFTSQQVPGQRYTLTVNNVKDNAAGTVIPANTTYDFTAWQYTRGLVTVDYFTGISSGSLVGNLLNEPKFINNSPDATEYKLFFGCGAYIPGGANYADNYGARVYGWFIAPSNGNYRFYIRSDDSSMLLMNTNAVNSMDPAGKVQIAGSTLACCGTYIDITKGPVISPVITLVSNQMYYMEALLKEGGSTDGVGVTFREVRDNTPLDNATPEAIPAYYFASMGNPDSVSSFYLTRQPTPSSSTTVGAPVLLSCAAFVNPVLPIAYQWQQYDSASGIWGDVFASRNPSASISNFVFTPTAGGTYQFRALVSVPGIIKTTDVAQVTVPAAEPTPVPPALLWASASTNLTTVTAYFSEPVTKASAENLANYTMVNNSATPITVSSATLQADFRTVVLTASAPLTANNQTYYTLTASGILDVDDESAGGGSWQFYVPGGLLRYDLYAHNSGTNVLPAVIPFWNPDVTGFLSNKFAYNSSMTVTTNGTANYMENYVGRFYGYLIPPSNGIYRFFIASDDASQLWLNTNTVNSTSPTGTVLVARGLSANLGYVNPAAISTWIPLNAGQRYYVEALLKEGTGGDYVSVAVREYADQTIPFQASASLGTNSECVSARWFSLAEGLSIIPTTQTAFTDGETAVFGNVVGVPAGVQWYLDNVAIANATNLTLTLNPITAAGYNGKTIKVVATNVYTSPGVTYSWPVTVSGDSVAPSLVSTYRDNTLTNLMVVFSEALDPTSAATAGNYSTVPSVTITKAVLLADGRTVVLSGAFDAATAYTVTVNGVKDRSASANALNGGTIGTTPLVFTPGFLNVDMFYYPGGTINTNLLLSDARYINNTPDVRWTIGSFDFHTARLPLAGHLYYCAKIYGWFVPPIGSSGQYVFYTRSDDTTLLYLNTTGTAPSGKTPISMTTSSGSFSTSGTISLTPGQTYYIELLCAQGSGQDYFSVDVRDAASPRPPIPNNNGTASSGYAGWASGYWAGAEVASGANFGVYGDPQTVSNLTFTVVPPLTMDAAAGQQVTLNVQATAMPANSYIFYQWQQNVGGTWVNLWPATNFIADYDMIGNGSNYTASYYYPTTLRAVATMPGGVTATSPEVTVNVTNAFDVTSVAAYVGGKVNVYFNKPLTTDSGVTNPDSYAIDDITPLAVRVLPDGRSVEITPAAPVGSTFKVTINYLYELTGNEYLMYAEYYGNATPAFDLMYDMGVAPLVPGGDPILPGSATLLASNALDIVAGGTDIWNTSNGCYYVARWVTGDFDISTRVAAMTNAYRGYPDINSKATILASVITNADSRQMVAAINPPAITGWPVTGANVWQFLYRDTRPTAMVNPGSISGAWPTPASTPWMRLVRKGSTFTAYRSLDGVNWIAYGTRDTAIYGGAYPDTILVGLGTTSHNNFTNTVNTLGPDVQPGLVTVKYRDLHFPAPARIDVQPPATLAGPAGSTVTIALTASMPADGGTLKYQWRKDGINLPYANSASLDIVNLQNANAGVYTCVVSDDGGGAISTPCVVSVINQPPSLAPETFSINQNSALVTNASFLLANDSDPEGRPLSLFDVSGIAPVTFFANFDDGAMPGKTAGYGYTRVADGDYASGKSLMLTPAIANTNGSFIIDDLIAGRPVSSFLVSFKFRLADGNNNPADGLSFNVASDLPSTSVIAAGAEEGAGTGLTFCIDNYDSGGIAEAPALDIKWRGVTVWHYPIMKMYTTPWIPVSLAMHPDGTMDVSFNNVQVAAGVQTGYTPIAGARYGFYARTGGSFESHAIDDVSITVLSSQSSLYSTHPAATSANFSNGLPANVKVYGNAYLTNDGAGYNFVRLTDSAAGQAGSLIFDELMPYQLVRNFSVSFDLRIAEGNGNADGFSFNFAPDLPNAGGVSYVNPPGFAAGTYGCEEGVGTGLSVTVDNYPATAPTIKVKWKGIGNTILASNQLSAWIDTNFIRFTVTLSPSNTLTVTTNGVAIFDNLPVPYAPIRGRFGFFARTGGSYESHAVGNVSITEETINTFAWYTDLNYFLPPDARLYGTASYASSGGQSNSPAIQLVPAAAGQSGALVIDEMTPFKPVSSFNSTFLLRMGDGSAEPAEGFSFNFAPDLTDDASATAEEGVGTGLSVCFDNYRGNAGAPNSAVVKLKWKGLEFASTTVAVWNSANYAPVYVGMNANGTITVTVDGTNLWNNFQTPYSPIRGRFGLYARTGSSEYQAVSVDNLAFYLPDAGYVGLQGTNLVYVPPQNTMGTDPIYYVVSDGVGGYGTGTNSVTVMDLTPPMILDVPHVPIGISNDCSARIPDFNLEATRVSLGLMATDTVGFITVEQTPVAGTLVPMSDINVTQSVSVIVRDASGNATNRTFDLVITDLGGPVISGWPADRVITNCEWTVIDLTGEVVATDCHAFTISQLPVPGTIFTGGTNIITFYAVDSYNNTSTVQTVVIIPNASPIGVNDTAAVKAGETSTFTAAKLLANDRHPDGREIFISQVFGSTNGAVVTLAPDWRSITYTPVPGFLGRDEFTYQISDPCGHTNTAKVVVDVYAAGEGQNLLSLSSTNGANVIRFHGIPGRAYSLQRTPDLMTPVWTTITNQLADPTGLIIFVDAAPLSPNGFYRTLNEVAP